MNRNLLKLQKIREANQYLENRYLLREQPAPVPAPAPAPPIPPSTAATGSVTTPSTPSVSNQDLNKPKKLTDKNLISSLEDAISQKLVKNCSTISGGKEEYYTYNGENYFRTKFNPTLLSRPTMGKDSWCKKE